MTEAQQPDRSPDGAGAVGAGGVAGARAGAGVSVAGGGVATLSGPEVVRVESVTRVFGRGTAARHALRGVSFSVTQGELVALVGRSGSGKTTLLNVISGLDGPTSGRVWVDGAEVTAMSRDEVLRLRRETVAMIFQSFALLPVLSAAENVGIPMRLARMAPADREQRARDLLSLVGLAGRERQRPYELSGGEQQRVAVARALANSPRLLLADEPTGQLDSATAGQIMGLLRTIVHAEGLTGIVATHDQRLMEIADRVIELRNGEMTAPAVS
jgi:putative ABC transport system ATP-binding protein